MARSRDISKVLSSNTTLATDAEVAASFIAKADGYIYRQTVYFTSSGTFSKASYPWLRAMRVKTVGAGGGGGSAAATNGSQYCIGGSGGGGGYAESFITDIAGLSSSETVTVGSGGAGGAAGTNAGSTGGTSSFGSLVSATGGGGGYIPSVVATSVTVYIRLTSAAGGGSGTGDLVIPGSQAEGDETGFASNFIKTAKGGNSFMGAGGESIGSNTTFVNNGKNYGGGATGRANSVSQSAGAGGIGGPGIVILELFA
jgi:hypothetical protein